MPKKKIPVSGSPKKDSRPPEKEKVIAAHDQAEKDIDQDPDLNSTSNPEDEMDEGELARLEGED